MMSLKTGSDKLHFLWYFAAGLSAFALVALQTQTYGAGMTHDSIAYLAAAKGLYTGKGLYYFGYHSAFIQWPPLYPLILAVFGGLGLDIQVAARFLNAVIFAATVMVSLNWFYRNLKYKLLILPASLSVLFCFALVRTTGFMWSEPLFILLSVLSLTGLQAYLHSGKIRILSLSAFWALLACFTRYSGLFLVASALVLLLLWRGRSFKTRIRDAVLFASIPGIPSVAWMLRNYALSSTFMGYRTASGLVLADVVKTAFKTVAAWFLPLTDAVLTGHSRLKNIMTYAAVFVLAIVFIILAVIVISNMTGMLKQYNIHEWLRKNSIGFLPHIVFAAVYSGFMTASTVLYAMDAIGDRYLLPVYIPLAMAAFFIADGLPLIFYKLFNSRTMTAAITALFLVWLCYPAYGTYKTVRNSIESGAGGYSTKGWQNSPTAAWLDANKPSGPVYSNNAGILLLLDNLDAEYFPKKTGPAAYTSGRFIKAVEASRSATLVFFDSVRADYLQDLTGMMRVLPGYKAILAHRAADGYVYNVSR